MKSPAEPTAIAAAFAAAGIKRPEERVMAIAIEAWRKWSALQGAGARTDHVRRELRADADLTWAFIKEYGLEDAVTRAVSRLLNDAREAIAAQQPRKRGDARVSVEAHTRGLPGTASDRGGRARPETHATSASPVGRRGGQTTDETQTGTAPLATLSNKHAEASAARLHVELRLADRIIVNGVPLRRCTVRDVRIWAEGRQREARNGWRDYLFAQHLIANLPGNEVIGERWRDNEIEDFYARAGADHGVDA